MPTVLITGGTGMIGKPLTGLLLKKGYQVIVLTRALPSNNPVAGLSYAIWDVSKQTIDIDAVQKADYIIHLAGAGVADKRWTNKRKKEIVASRTQSAALLVKALHRKHKPGKSSYQCFSHWLVCGQIQLFPMRILSQKRPGGR